LKTHFRSFYTHFPHFAYHFPPNLSLSLSISPQPHCEPATVNHSQARHSAFSISSQKSLSFLHLRFGSKESNDPTTVPPQVAPTEPPPTSPSTVSFYFYFYFYFILIFLFIFSPDPVFLIVFG
jgi:hypothetical protein